MKNRIGAAIRKKRKELGLSQEELAEKVSKTPSFIGQIERGKAMPRIETLALLTQHLSIDANVYFYDSIEHRKERREFYIMLEQMPPNMRKLAQDLVRSVYKASKLENKK